jgi:hypothetical protein
MTVEAKTVAANEVSLSMLQSASAFAARPSAAISRLKHQLRAEIAARRETERENLRLRLELQTLLRRLARRSERPAVVAPHAGPDARQARPRGRLRLP